MTYPAPIRLKISFDKILRTWDGFGFNYVETAQTRDYQRDPQDYGGFSLLSETARQEILEQIFGEAGLKPGILKMFLDPFHEPSPGHYDHQTTTHWMRYFARSGLQITRARGADLQIIVTLYGPPAWMTRQQVLRGRDLLPACEDVCAAYLISWAQYLRTEEGLPVRYLSLHNEGEDWVRWPADGSDDPEHAHHDYNFFCSPEQVVRMIKVCARQVRAQSIPDLFVTCGETTNWQRFYDWGYADEIADDPQAVADLGLITSHGFYAPVWNHWYGDWRSVGIDVLRARKPALHAWVTSTSWAKMDVEFINEIRNNIYSAGVNAVIPWAGVQVRGKWVGGDPNPGTAFLVHPDGHYEILPGYAYYKQVCQVGQPGMGVARVASNDTLVGAIAFSSNSTSHPDAFVVLNLDEKTQAVDISITPSQAKPGERVYLKGFRTSPVEANAELSPVVLHNGSFIYQTPPRSVTTFILSGG